MKLEVGLGSVTKPVAAMCLSKMNANVQNWSSEVRKSSYFSSYFIYSILQMVLSSTINIEAALFNEHTFTWEPLIEPAIDPAGNHFTPWGVSCSIAPVSTY